jgi:multimeric flavodoxin WrbA
MLTRKNVVIIFGSPRKNSNTHILVKEARKGLADNGVSSEIFYLNEMNIKGCQACYYCKRKNVSDCAVKDDMQKIHEAIHKADGILVASPIYFGGVTAQTKAWLDRLFPFIGMNVNSLMAKGKKAAFIFTQNQPAPELFANCIDSFKMMMGFIGFEVKDSLLAYNLDKGYKPMVTENKEFMSKAYELGRDLLS